MKSVASVAGAIVLCAAGSTCRADPPRCVVLSPPACRFPSLDRATLVRALRVELASAGLELEEAACRSPGLVVTIEPVGCEETTRKLEIAVSGPRAGERSSRLVSIDDVASAMVARTLAIATAEVVGGVATGEAGGAEPSPATETSGSDAPPSASAAPASAPSMPVAAPSSSVPPVAMPPAPRLGYPPVDLPSTAPPRPRAVLAALAEYRSYVSPATQLFGARVSTAWGMAFEGLELRADAVYAQASRDVTLGSVSVNLLAGSLGAQWVTRGAPLTVFVGTLAELGYAWTSGRASGSAQRGSGGRPTIALVADVGARLAVAPRWVVSVEASGGAELAGLRALVDDLAVGGVSGGLFSLRAGAGYTFR